MYYILTVSVSINQNTCSNMFPTFICIYYIYTWFTSFRQNKIIKNPLLINSTTCQGLKCRCLQEGWPRREKRWKLWGWGYQPLECGPISRWQVGLMEIFSVFSICWLFVNEVWLWSFHVVSKHVCLFFHFDPWRNVFWVIMCQWNHHLDQVAIQSCTTDARQIGTAVNRSYNSIIFLHSSSAKSWCLRGNFREVLGPSWFHVPFAPIYSSKYDWLHHRHSIHEISKSCFRRWSESAQRTGMMSLCGLGVKNLRTGMLFVHFSLEIKTMILQVRKDDGNIITCLRCVSKVAKSWYIKLDCINDLAMNDTEIGELVVFLCVFSFWVWGPLVIFDESSLSSSLCGTVHQRYSNWVCQNNSNCLNPRWFEHSTWWS